MADIRENIQGTMPVIKLLDTQLSSFGLSLKHVKAEDIEKLNLRLNAGEFLIKGQLVLIKSIVTGSGIPAIVTRVTHVNNDHFIYKVAILTEPPTPNFTLNIGISIPTLPLIIDVNNVQDALNAILSNKLGNDTSRDLLIKYGVDGIYTLDNVNKQFKVHM